MPSLTVRVPRWLRGCRAAKAIVQQGQNQWGRGGAVTQGGAVRERQGVRRESETFRGTRCLESRYRAMPRPGAPGAPGSGWEGGPGVRPQPPAAQSPWNQTYHHLSVPWAPTDPRDYGFKPRVGVKGILSCQPDQKRGRFPAVERTPKPTSVTSSAPPPPPALSRPPSATKWQSQILWRQGAESAGLRVLRTQGGKVTL